MEVGGTTLVCNNSSKNDWKSINELVALKSYLCFPSADEDVFTLLLFDY